MAVFKMTLNSSIVCEMTEDKVTTDSKQTVKQNLYSQNDWTK